MVLWKSSGVCNSPVVIINFKFDHGPAPWNFRMTFATLSYDSGPLPGNCHGRSQLARDPNVEHRLRSFSVYTKVSYYAIDLILFPYPPSALSFSLSPPALPPRVSSGSNSNNRKTAKRQPLEVALSMPYSRRDPMSKTD